MKKRGNPEALRKFRASPGHKAILEKASAARKAARAARGGVGYSALITALAIQAAEERGIELTPSALVAATGASRSRYASHITSLLNAGYLRKIATGHYLTANPASTEQLKPKHIAELRTLLLKLGLGPTPAAAPAPVAPRADRRTLADLVPLKQALAALEPFARYGARIGEAKGDVVPMLLRRDGLTNASFQAAQAAKERLLAALGEVKEEKAPAASEDSLGMDRYFDM